MECINCGARSPILAVDDVIIELRHLSSLCNVLSQVNGEHTVISLEAVGDTMMLIRDLLDRQIDALDGIQWLKGKAAGA